MLQETTHDFVQRTPGLYISKWSNTPSPKGRSLQELNGP